MTVGRAIKSLRTAAGLLQRDVAERVGISQSMLSLVEADKREPSISVLRAIGRTLNVPTAVLFALALQNDDIGRGTPSARKTRKIIDDLFEAAMLAIRARA